VRGDLVDDRRARDGGRVDRRLVGAVAQEPVDVGDLADSSAVRATTSKVVSRSPEEAVTSRNVSSSAPARS
jgi:hypothetical protein